MSVSADAGIISPKTRPTRPRGRMHANAAAQVPFLVPILSPVRQWILRLGLASWFVTLGFFWIWWLKPDHIGYLGSYIFATLVLAWLTLMPMYFLLNVHASRKPSKLASIPKRSRVAMVVTKAPSEPFAVVARTLEAMLTQDYPHDTWLADEDPSEETVRWCDAHGVFISTRRGREDYHRKTWPRRTRCKEGNLAFFYDHYGYERYDFVAQMDADHRPTPTYLREILYPFADPAVGYVSAPSICDNNAAESWAARGRLFPEGMFHGPLQSGHTGGGAPLCIGSHYAVRTKALRQAGGLGPELAEDHSTSMLINAAGWRGVHALDAIAHGDGPQTFADLVTQEFQWSRSLMTILLEYSPTYFPKLPWRLKFQFLFCQLWYPLFAIFALLMYVMPMYALFTGRNFANVMYADFLLHYLPNAVALVGLVMMLKAFGLSRPLTAKTISWEGTLFLFFARWPWVLAGTLSSLRDYLTKSFVDFRVTPKGSGPKSLLPVRAFVPYVALAIGAALPVLIIEHPFDATGFFWFAAFNAFLYGLLVVVIVSRHVIENKIPLRANAAKMTLQASLAVLALAVPAVGFYDRGMEGVYGLQQGAGGLRIVRIAYVISGAGQGNIGARNFYFDPGWETPR
ncbi:MULTISPECIES: cellulose synthase catalytic subunit [unclassified Mesorhizobium]|uniref:glycosyltransferase family 2 protein n=2 Tax=unclassified Mesorhizobium TaxID=325217 RepID=UPI000FCA8B50|nr:MULTISPECIES: cellulose synthase catalytic subunit [unclassified Mesorhizobium]RUW55984.1 glycosyltransferase [Mesorhizobium sp. M8A.F.Ca.ET.021.01.1.1]RWC70250.1 MAG: glycosyltransferase [Mesorhizobium sp.]TGP95732.1 glycosyltransferase [Mesorhizobium sp. M8A.F.Ca.ET.218.01.1.1]TGQ95699.1 glycosyltransferase [Mesorhizobium sp. M8A.F.Ca.ET.208.01.1.1]TGS45830.1 glycosyltransferase [Mesorhizobium sp. M8A.F.Ca.ET.182.01.1.1]